MRKSSSRGFRAQIEEEEAMDARTRESARDDRRRGPGNAPHDEDGQAFSASVAMAPAAHCVTGGLADPKPLAALGRAGPENPWHEVLDEFGDPDQFQERHYNEFVAFLPQVRRFLYGQGLGRRVGASYGDSPIRVYRRQDIAAVRMTFAADRPPVRFEVAHVDLYFFYDSDVVMLALEIYADDLPFDTAQEAIFRFGRAYPGSWDQQGRAHNCLLRAEWLSVDATVLAESDYDRREKYLSFVCRHRAPAIASHWAFLFRPLVLHHSDEKGVIRFRQIEHYLLPFLAYFAMDDMSALTRADAVRMAFGSGPGDPDTLPYAASLSRRLRVALLL